MSTRKTKADQADATKATSADAPQAAQAEPTSADAPQAAQAEPTPADANQVAAAAVSDIAVTEPAAAPQAVTPPPVMTISIKCTRRTGIWRAGRFWPHEPTLLNFDDFSDEQLAQICAEPLLVADQEPGHE